MIGCGSWLPHHRAAVAAAAADHGCVEDVPGSPGSLHSLPPPGLAGARAAAAQVSLLDPVVFPGAIKAFAKEVCRNDLLNFGRLHWFFPDSRLALDLNTDKALKVCSCRARRPALPQAQYLQLCTARMWRGAKARRRQPSLWVCTPQPMRSAHVLRPVSCPGGHACRPRGRPTPRVCGQEARFDRHFVRDLTWSRHQLEELAERRCAPSAGEVPWQAAPAAADARSLGWMVRPDPHASVSITSTSCGCRASPPGLSACVCRLRLTVSATPGSSLPSRRPGPPRTA